MVQKIANETALYAGRMTRLLISVLVIAETLRYAERVLQIASNEGGIQKQSKPIEKRKVGF